MSSSARTHGALQGAGSQRRKPRLTAPESSDDLEDSMALDQAAKRLPGRAATTADAPESDMEDSQQFQSALSDGSDDSDDGDTAAPHSRLVGAAAALARGRPGRQPAAAAAAALARGRPGRQQQKPAAAAAAGASDSDELSEMDSDALNDVSVDDVQTNSSEGEEDDCAATAAPPAAARSQQQTAPAAGSQQQQRTARARGAAAAAASDSDGSSENSSSSESESESGSGSDSEAAGAAAGRRGNKLQAGAGVTPSATPSGRRRPAPAAAAAAAAAGRGSSRRAPAAKQPTAAAAAATTPQRGRPPKAPAATTPSDRPVRGSTQTPQRARGGAATPAAAAAGGGGNPSLATPLRKLSLSSKPASSGAEADAPPSAAAGARSRSRAAAAATTAAIAASTPKQQQQQQPSKQRRPAATPSAKARAASTKKPPVLRQVVVGDVVIMPGDDVYLMQDDYEGGSDSEEEEEAEACEVCSKTSSTRANAMLECSCCLRGFHLRCLKPPLKAVPEGDWLCPGCNAGKAPPPPARLVTRWQRLLYGANQLSLVHVVGLQRGKSPEGEEEEQLLVRYYLLPQDTHVGRQPHHAARELFLSTKTFVEPSCAFMAQAFVHPPADFAAASEAEGNDVFLCEYEYDEDWKRFKQRRYAGSSSGGGDDGGGTHAGACPMTPAGLRLTPAKERRGATPRSGGSRRLFGDDSSSDDDYDGDGSASDEDRDDTYRPELHWSQRAKGSLPVKRRRQGGLDAGGGTAAGADKFAGLGAADIGHDRGQPTDVFAKLHACLSLGAVPESLPCREEERRHLGGFLTRALKEDGGVLYICGVPGTGKTALAMEVLRGLRPQAMAAGAQVVTINCLQLPTPQHVFSRLWEKLSGQHLGPARAAEALMQSFGISGSGSTRRRSYSTIVVLDEIDMLMTRDQAVLYQVFDWPSQPGSRLAVIGISNTHDLDQRVLPRIASRLDQAKLAFAPYSVTQLQAIVSQRLEASGMAGAVEELPVSMACRKVASETGDVRRALELLRRAVEIGRADHLRSTVVARTAAAAAAGQAARPQDHAVVFEWQEGSPALVKRVHYTQAQQEMFGALHLQLLRSRSTWEKVLLVAVVVEARATGRAAVVMQAVAERASTSICSLVDLAPPSLGVLQHCLVKLAGVRLLLSDGCHIKAQVALNVDKDDVAIAIREDERLQRLHQLL